jgi:hypothetical protein
VQERLKQAGKDARSSDVVRSKHRAATSRQMAQIQDWEAMHPTEPFGLVEYRRGVARRLRDVPIGVLRDATGLSVVYCRQIRLGKRVPHQRHWEALRRVANSLGDRVPSDWDARFYLREIVPKLEALAPAAIAKATGLSIPYCKRLRRGQQLPRRHHWPALFKAVSGRVRDATCLTVHAAP